MKNNSTKRPRQKRIEVTDEVYNSLRDEFNCSGVTVLNTLKLFTQSDLADQIRNRAMKLMEETAMKNQKLLEETKAEA